VHTDVGNATVGWQDQRPDWRPLTSESSMATSRDRHLERPDRAANRLGILGGDRQERARRSGAATRTAVRTHIRPRPRIVMRLFQRAKMSIPMNKLQGALPRLARGSVEDVMAAVGRSELRPPTSRAMYPRLQGRRAASMAVKPKAERAGLLEEADLGESKVPGMSVRGRLSDPGSMAICGALRARRWCGARAIASSASDAGRGITIYPIQSASLAEFEDKPESWLDVRWDDDENTPQRFPARIESSRRTSRAPWRRSRR